MMTDNRIENKDSNVFKCNTNTNIAEYPLIKNNLIVFSGYLRIDIGSPNWILLLLKLSEGLIVVLAVVVVAPEAETCCCSSSSCRRRLLQIFLLLCCAIVSTILAPKVVEVDLTTSTVGSPLACPSSAVSDEAFISCYTHPRLGLRLSYQFVWCMVLAYWSSTASHCPFRSVIMRFLAWY